MPLIEWEKIPGQMRGDSGPPLLYMYRTKIPGGWLFAWGDGLTFVPDPNHEWDGNSLPW